MPDRQYSKPKHSSCFFIFIQWSCAYSARHMTYSGCVLTQPVTWRTVVMCSLSPITWRAVVMCLLSPSHDVQWSCAYSARHMTYNGHMLTQPRHMTYSGHVLTQPVTWRTVVMCLLSPSHDVQWSCTYSAPSHDVQWSCAYSSPSHDIQWSRAYSVPSHDQRDELKSYHPARSYLGVRQRHSVSTYRELSRWWLSSWCTSVVKHWRLKPRILGSTPGSGGLRGANASPFGC